MRDCWKQPFSSLFQLMLQLFKINSPFDQKIKYYGDDKMVRKKVVRRKSRRTSPNNKNANRLFLPKEDKQKEWIDKNIKTSEQANELYSMLNDVLKECIRLEYNDEGIVDIADIDTIDKGTAFEGIVSFGKDLIDKAFTFDFDKENEKESGHRSPAPVFDNPFQEAVRVGYQLKAGFLTSRISRAYQNLQEAMLSLEFAFEDAREYQEMVEKGKIPDYAKKDFGLSSNNDFIQKKKVKK